MNSATLDRRSCPCVAANEPSVSKDNIRLKLPVTLAEASGRRDGYRFWKLRKAVVHPARFERATIRLEGGCSIQLSYGCKNHQLHLPKSFVNPTRNRPLRCSNRCPATAASFGDEESTSDLNATQHDFRDQSIERPRCGLNRESGPFLVRLAGPAQEERDERKRQRLRQLSAGVQGKEGQGSSAPQRNENVSRWRRAGRPQLGVAVGGHPPFRCCVGPQCGEAPFKNPAPTRFPRRLRTCSFHTRSPSDRMATRFELVNSPANKPIPIGDGYGEPWKQVFQSCRSACTDFNVGQDSILSNQPQYIHVH